MSLLFTERIRELKIGEESVVVRLASLSHHVMDYGHFQVLWAPKLLRVLKHLRNDQYAFHDRFERYNRILLFQ